MSVSYTFNGSGALPNPPWTSALGSLNESGNELVGGGGTYNISLYTLYSFNAAQDASCQLSGGISGFNNLILRGNANNFYFLRFNVGTGFVLERVLGGVFGTSINASATNPAAGDFIQFTIDAAFNYAVYRNAGLLFSGTDGTAPGALAAGSPGVGAYDTSDGIESWIANGEIVPPVAGSRFWPFGAI